MKEATLRLFRAIKVEDQTKRFDLPLDRMIRYGYILDPAIRPTKETLDIVEKTLGLSGDQANASFHKSWKVVKDTPMEVLVIQQIAHYITTYGFEQLGIYNSDTVYIPDEALEVPDVKLGKLPLIVVKAMTKEQIFNKVVDLGTSGVALQKGTLDDLMEIVKTELYPSDFVTGIKNREFKSLLYDHYGLVPTDPMEFLRYVVAKLTGESLLIKNKDLIEKIKGSDPKVLDALIQKAPWNLGSVFLRYKPLFLAMKSISSNKRFFNQLRRSAEGLHKPIPEDYLNSVTAKIRKKEFDLDELKNKLQNATIYRKIRLVNALAYRRSSADSIVYRVRNGKGWASEFDWPEKPDIHTQTRQALIAVAHSISDDLRESVEGQTIYLPKHVNYTLPATEKMFTGNFPTGTSVQTEGNTIVGIHWVNPKGKRVDLDLSIIGESGKLGWNAAYRSEDTKILFSGDMTDAPAPKGASEMFYFEGHIPEPHIILVNYFNMKPGDEVECELFVAQQTVKSLEKNYMVNPNNILARSKINLTKKQNIIGLITHDRVYFANMSVGKSITSRQDDNSTRSRSYLVNSVTSNLDLRDILRVAGATVVEEKPNYDFIDLSPESLDKTTILDLMAGSK